MCSESEFLPFMSSPPHTNHNTPQQRIGGSSAQPPPPPQPRPPFSLRKMSCNGCRVLRKGCSENCILRQCLQWIESPQSQAHATVFVAKFFGRAGLMAFIAAVHERERPALFKSLLYEACGRTVSPVHGAVGLLWTGKWHLCQAAVEKVLNGGTLEKNRLPSMDPNERVNFASPQAHETLNFPSVEAYGRSSFPSVDADERANIPLIDANGLEIPTNGERPSSLADEDFDIDIHSRSSIPEIFVEIPAGGRKRFSGGDVCRIYEIEARVSSCTVPENAQRRRVRQRTGDEERAVNGDVDSGAVTAAVAVNDDGENVEEDGNTKVEGNLTDMASTDGDGGENLQQAQRQNPNNAEGDIKLDLSLNNCQSKSKSSNLKQQRVSSPSTNSVTSEGSVNRTKAPASPTSQKLLDLL